jgi:hypothetical protein
MVADWLQTAHQQNAELASLEPAVGVLLDLDVRARPLLGWHPG